VRHLAVRGRTEFLHTWNNYVLGGRFNLLFASPEILQFNKVIFNTEAQSANRIR